MTISAVVDRPLVQSVSSHDDSKEEPLFNLYWFFFSLLESKRDLGQDEPHQLQ